MMTILSINNFFSEPFLPDYQQESQDKLQMLCQFYNYLFMRV